MAGVADAGNTSSGTLGKELFYRDGDKMMAVDVVIRNGEPVVSQPRMLFEGALRVRSAQTVPDYDASPDGQRFLMVKGAPGRSRLSVVLHLFDNPAALERAVQ